MKYILVLGLIFGSFFPAIAQDFCATQMPDEMMDWLRDYKTNNRAPQYNKSSNDITYIPVKIHIVGDDNGSGYYKLSTLLGAFCTLNAQYEPYGWHFYMYNGINYINNTSLYSHTGNYRGIINSESVPDVANIFFVDDPSGACGYFSGYGGPRGSNGQRQGYIAIENGSCAAEDNSTVAHELGHFFSLPHTFYGWEGRAATDSPGWNDERVDGSNCGFAGDYFCDTPADYLSDRWQCPYNKTKTDYNGDLYNPDGALYMSYSDDACTQYFSNEQVDAMKSYLGGTRSYMLDVPYPGYEEITDSAYIEMPAQFSNGIAANFVQMKWNKVENATQYLVQLKYDGPQIVFILDTLVSDTALTLALDEYKGYAFRVKAFNPAYTCSAMSNFTIFTTGPNSPMDPTVSVNSVTCNNAFDGQIQVNVQGGQTPLTYQWSTGATSANLSNLTQGKYTLTVTDQNNTSIVVDVDIVEPDPIDVELEQVGNSLVSTVTGGTPIYNYAWSTGSSGTGVQLTNAGDYTLTVTDANGCQATKTFNATGVETVVAGASFSIYPNPVANGQNVTLELEFLKSIQATDISVYELSGRMVSHMVMPFEAGTNTIDLNSSELNAGIYMVRISDRDGSFNLTRKLVIL